jgi:hypothetical protein
MRVLRSVLALYPLFAAGKTLETQSHSDAWLSMAYSLSHVAGPLFSFNASAFSAEGAPPSVRIPQDPEQEMAEDCDQNLRPHELPARGGLISPDEKTPDRIKAWSSCLWKKSVSSMRREGDGIAFLGGSKGFSRLLGKARSELLNWN